MEISPSNKNIAILIHLFAWILMAIVLFLLTPLSWNIDVPNQFWVKQGMLLLLLIGVFYLNMHVLVPGLLFRGRIWYFLGMTIGICFLLMFFMQTFETWINLREHMHRAFRPNEAYVPRDRKFTLDLFNLLIFLFGLGISTTIATIRKWQLDEAVRISLEQEKINSELSYLKAQINPHFFFNTLNNIYALTSIDIEKARTAIHKLSRMMRYVLYETEKDHTLLSKEIDFIHDYIELMRLRLSEKVSIQLEIEKNYTDLPIAPMLLLPFIENSFKHGVSSREPSKIVIKVQMKGNELHLYTKNKIFPMNPQSPENKSAGIGLINTRRRLSLIYGPKFELSIDDQNPEKEYIVNLKIDLAWKSNAL